MIWAYLDVVCIRFGISLVKMKVTQLIAVLFDSILRTRRFKILCLRHRAGRPTTTRAIPFQYRGVVVRSALIKPYLMD